MQLSAGQRGCESRGEIQDLREGNRSPPPAQSVGFLSITAPSHDLSFFFQQPPPHLPGNKPPILPSSLVSSITWAESPPHAVVLSLELWDREWVSALTRGTELILFKYSSSCFAYAPWAVKSSLWVSVSLSAACGVDPTPQRVCRLSGARTWRDLILVHLQTWWRRVGCDVRGSGCQSPESQWMLDVNTHHRYLPLTLLLQFLWNM